MANKMQVLFNNETIATIEVGEGDVEILFKDRDVVKLSNDNIIDCEYVRAIIHKSPTLPAVY